MTREHNQAAPPNTTNTAAADNERNLAVKRMAHPLAEDRKTEKRADAIHMTGNGFPHCLQYASTRGVIEPQARHILCDP
jgi:hypothetical protein